MRYVKGNDSLALMATLAQYISRPVPHNAFLGISEKRRGNGSQKRAHQVDRIAEANRMLKKASMALLVVALASSVALAGVYADGRANPLSPSQTVKVWTAESPTPGTGAAAASSAVLLAPGQNPQGVTPFHAVGYFSGAPGTFEIDVQGADEDVSARYQTFNGCAISTVDATNFTFRCDAVSVSSKYVRLLLRARGNAVSVTAWIGR